MKDPRDKEIEEDAPRGSSWLPIETAPKQEEIFISNGTYICIGVFDCARVEDSLDPQDFDSYVWFAKSPVGIADIDDERHLVEILEGETPTIWMPIPDPQVKNDAVGGSVPASQKIKGVELRDYFAARALPNLFSSERPLRILSVAVKAYLVADGMLKVRSWGSEDLHAFLDQHTRK